MSSASYNHNIRLLTIQVAERLNQGSDALASAVIMKIPDEDVREEVISKLHLYVPKENIESFLELYEELK